MKKLFVILFLAFSLQPSAFSLTPVSFSFVDASGNPIAASFTLRPNVSLVGYSTNLVVGGPITITTTNGTVTTNILAGSYVFQMIGQSTYYYMLVPDTNVTLNAETLITNLPVAVAATFPGVIQLLPGAGYSLSPTNGQGFVSLVITNAGGGTNILLGSTATVTVTNIGGTNFFLVPTGTFDAAGQSASDVAAYSNTVAAAGYQTAAQATNISTNAVATYTGNLAGNAASATVADSVTNGWPISTVYIAPWGSETNFGHSPLSPWGNFVFAENWCSNYIASGQGSSTLTYALAGNNTNTLTNGTAYVFTVPGMNYHGEPGAMIILTNGPTGVNASRPPLIGIASNQIWDNFWLTVQGGTSAANSAGQINIGFYGTNAYNVANCIFNGGGIYGSSQAVHFEYVTNANVNVDFNNFYMQGLNTFVYEFCSGCNIRLNGCTLYATNWWGIPNTGQEYAMKIGNSSGYFSVRNTLVQYTDQGNNSKPACVILNNSATLSPTNYLNAPVNFNGLTINAMGVTNPLSFDIYNLNNTTNCFTGAGVVRVDGLPVSETNTVWPLQSFYTPIYSTNISWAGYP